MADLISGITFIVLFQSGEASMVEGNKHTHTHTFTNLQILWCRSTNVGTIKSATQSVNLITKNIKRQ